MQELKKVFIDTNILIHFRLFTEIDWCSVLNSKFVVLNMTSTNIKELEKFKYDQNKKRSERARKVIKLIESLEEIEVTTFKVRENVTLHIIINEPTSRIFDEFNLDQKIEDDRIIASVLQLADSKEEKISIITNDLNLRLKAKLFGISVFNLTEEFELEQELDSNEKKIRQLTDELMRYKNSLPDLKILFHDKTEIQEFILEKPAVDQSAHIDEQMKLIKIKYQPKEFPQKDSFAYLPLSIGGMFTEKDYQNYNEELKEFYTTYEAYLIEKFLRLNRKSLSTKLELIVLNSGGSPGEDIGITLYFPDGFDVYSNQEYVSEPIPPKVPELRNRMFDAVYSSRVIHDSLLHSFIPRGINPSNVSGYTIKKTNSYEINLSIQKLKHFFQEELDPVYIVFSSYNEANSFSFQYRLTAANLPIEKSGKLNVVIKKEAKNVE